MRNKTMTAVKLILSTVVLATALVSCSEEVKHSEPKIVKSSLTATAMLVSQDSVTLSPPSVTSMFQYKIQFMARENKAVKKGEVVLKFDAQQLRNSLVKKQSELSAALKEREQETLQQDQREQVLKLDLAEAKKNKDKEERKANIVDLSISGIEKAKQKKQYEIAKARLNQANQRLENFYESEKVNAVVAESKINRLTADVNRIKSEIAKLSIKSPKDGIIMYVTNHNGEKQAVGDSVWQGQQILTIPSLDKIAIQAQFDEPDLTKVTIGRPVKVTLDAYPEIPFTGKITSLGQAFKNKSRSNQRIVFDAYITLDEVNSELMRPGMQGKVELLDSKDAS